MKQHPYLRAYLAGIAVPTPLLLVATSVFLTMRVIGNLPIPIERVIIFPMAVVPNLWGVWNMLYVSRRHGRWLPLGWHGAILPVFLVPAGFFLAQTQITFPPILASGAFFIGWPFATVAYYLAWKFLVGFLNQELGIA